jgi:hypothetical protein
MGEEGVVGENIQKKADLPHAELSVHVSNYYIMDLRYRQHHAKT